MTADRWTAIPRADRDRAIRAALGYDSAEPSPHLDRLREAADGMFGALRDPEASRRWADVAADAALAWLAEVER